MHGAGIFIFCKKRRAILVHCSNPDPFMMCIAQSDRLKEDHSVWCYNKVLAANALKYDFFIYRDFHKAKMYIETF